MEITEQRDVPEELRVMPAATDPAVDPALVAGRVDDEAAADQLRLALRVRVPHAPYPVTVFDDVSYRRPLADLDTLAAGVIEQDLVEAHPLHLVGRGRTVGEFWRQGEGERPRLW